MTALDDFKKFILDAESGTQFEKWAHDNPGELTRWSSYKQAVLSGGTVTAPTMLTAHGKELIDAAQLYLDTKPVTTPTSTPTDGYDKLTDWQLPPFNPTKDEINCHTQADLMTAIHNLGSMSSKDYIKINCLDGFVCADEITWDLELPGSFSDPHVLVDWGKTKAIGKIAAFYGRNFKNVLMRGGEFNSSGAGIFIACGSGFQWLDFNCHDNGHDGLDLFPGIGPIAAFKLKGVLTNNGLDISTDPHSEKGTGIHACNSADQSHTFGDPLLRSQLALKIYNQPTGAGLELGDTSPVIQNIDLYLFADTIGRALPGTTWDGYAKSQVAGNLLQIWGSGAFKSVKVKYMEGHNMMGRMIETNGLYSGVSLDLVVEYARGTNNCLSPRLKGQTQYPTAPGLVYLDKG